jgi:hypothetical protein
VRKTWQEKVEDNPSFPKVLRLEKGFGLLEQARMPPLHCPLNSIVCNGHSNLGLSLMAGMKCCQTMY